MALTNDLPGGFPYFPKDIYGVKLALIPGDVTLLFDVQRAPDSSGSPGTWVTIATGIGPFSRLGGFYTDVLPNNGALWWYRARHSGPAADPGSYTQTATSTAPYRLGDGASDPGQPGYPLLRQEQWTDAKYAVMAATNDGKNADRQVRVDGQVRTWVQLASTPELLPNAEFDIWETTTQPHVWTVDTGDSSSALKDTGTVFSGDSSAKFTFGGGGSAGTYRGFTTNDLTKGAFCLPLRAGRTYRFLVAVRTSAVGAGESCRLTLTFASGGSPSASQTYAFVAANAWEMFSWIVSVPGAAEANSRLAIEFTRGNTTSHDFYVDSLRVVEDVVDPTALATQLAAAGGNFVQNPDFEDGTAFWKETAGANFFDSTASSPVAGTRSGTFLTVASTIQRVVQCVRHTDLVNPSQGTNLFVPVDGGDEIFGSIKFVPSTADSSATAAFGIEEYDAAKAFIQRTTLGSTTPVAGTNTISGGAMTQATTAFVVPFIQYTAGSGGGSITIKWDTYRLYRTIMHRRVKVFNSGNQSITNDTETLLTWDSEDFDAGAMHSTASNTGRINVTNDMLGHGMLALKAQAQFAVDADGYRAIRIYRVRSAASTLWAETLVPSSGGAVVTTIQCATDIDVTQLQAGDYFEARVRHTAGAALNVNSGVANSWFSAKHDF